MLHAVEDASDVAHIAKLKSRDRMSNAKRRCDVFLSDPQHTAGDRLQCCVSRVVSPRTGGLPGADGRQASVTIDIQ